MRLFFRGTFHFQMRKFETFLVGLDSGKSLCEANEKCGLAAEARGVYEKARDFLRDARKISRDRGNWKHEDGTT